MILNNKTKNILIKGYYVFNNYEYTIEKAVKETETFLLNHLKYINNISDINFENVSISNRKTLSTIYVFFDIKSIDIKDNFIENKYLVRGVVEELEGLLGTKLSIELD